jgi:uncharacterized protein (TIGR00369 family)
MTVAMSAPDAVPAGFRPVTIASDFLRLVGPLSGRWDGERLRLGFRVEERHVNIARRCHGGMLCTFADMQMAVAPHYQLPEIAGHSFPTISLSIDFISAVALGAWVEGTADVLRATASLVFMQGTATADRIPAIRFSGVYKIGPKPAYHDPLDPFGLKAERPQRK